MTGHGLQQNVEDAYRRLMQCHGPGDRVYLFGFSRGAFTVRSLAGMLHKCGLLGPGHENLVEDLRHRGERLHSGGVPKHLRVRLSDRIHRRPGHRRFTGDERGQGVARAHAESGRSPKAHESTAASSNAGTATRSATTRRTCPRTLSRWA